MAIHHRNRRRTLITVAAIAFSLGTLIFLSNFERDIPGVVAMLKQSVYPGTLSVMTWEELIPMVVQMIEFQNGMIFVVVLVILAIVTAGVLNTMLMSVSERIPEFGLMMAMGTPARLSTLESM